MVARLGLYEDPRTRRTLNQGLRLARLGLLPEQPLEEEEPEESAVNLDMLPQAVPAAPVVVPPPLPTPQPTALLDTRDRNLALSRARAALPAYERALVEREPQPVPELQEPQIRVQDALRRLRAVHSSLTETEPSSTEQGEERPFGVGSTLASLREFLAEPSRPEPEVMPEQPERPSATMPRITPVEQRGGVDWPRRQIGPYDDVVRRYAGDLADDSDFLAVVAAAQFAESGFRPHAIGDGGRAVGLYQMHERGAGSGLSVAQRQDPDFASSIMVPQFVAAYRQVRAGQPNLMGAELASLVAGMVERPQDWQEPNSQARWAYRNAYERLVARDLPGAVGSAVGEAAQAVGGVFSGIGSVVRSVLPVRPAGQDIGEERVRPPYQPPSELYRPKPDILAQDFRDAIRRGTLMDEIGRIHEAGQRGYEIGPVRIGGAEPPVGIVVPSGTAPLGYAVGAGMAVSDLGWRSSVQLIRDVAAEVMPAIHATPALKQIYDEQGPDAAFNAWWTLYGDQYPAPLKGLIENAVGIIAGVSSPGLIASRTGGVLGTVTRAAGAGLEAVNIATAGEAAPLVVATSPLLRGRPRGVISRQPEETGLGFVASTPAERYLPPAEQAEVILRTGRPKELTSIEELGVAKELADVLDRLWDINVTGLSRAERGQLDRAIRDVTTARMALLDPDSSADFVYQSVAQARASVARTPAISSVVTQPQLLLREPEAVQVTPEGLASGAVAGAGGAVQAAGEEGITPGELLRGTGWGLLRGVATGGIGGRSAVRAGPRLAAIVGKDVPPERLTIARSVEDPGKVYEFQYRLVPLQELVTSQKSPFSTVLNPEYPAELQPRQRERAASRLQIERIAAGLVPEALIDDVQALDRGSAIIGPDNVVESGNGRILALRLAHDRIPDKWDAYQASLRAAAPRFGFDPAELSRIEAPVLVRERLTDVDRAAFTREANQPSVMAFATQELAQADALKLSDDLLITLTPTPGSVEHTLLAAVNRPIIQEFVKALPKEQWTTLLTAGGDLSSSGIARIQAAIFMHTFPGPAGESLSRTFIESPNPIIRNIEHGVMSALPSLARAEALIKTGTRAGDLSVGQDISKTLDVLARLKQAQIPVDQYLAQGQLFERELSPLQEQLLAAMNRMARSPRLVRSFLEGYVDLVERSPDPRQGTMFGDISQTKGILLERAAVGARETAEGELPLFEAPSVTATTREGLVAQPGRMGPTGTSPRPEPIQPEPAGALGPSGPITSAVEVPAPELRRTPSTLEALQLEPAAPTLEVPVPAVPEIPPPSVRQRRVPPGRPPGGEPPGPQYPVLRVPPPPDPDDPVLLHAIARYVPTSDVQANLEARLRELWGKPETVPWAEQVELAKQRLADRAGISVVELVRRNADAPPAAMSSVLVASEAEQVRLETAIRRLDAKEEAGFLSIPQRLERQDLNLQATILALAVRRELGEHGRALNIARMSIQTNMAQHAAISWEQAGRLAKTAKRDLGELRKGKELSHEGQQRLESLTEMLRRNEQEVSPDVRLLEQASGTRELGIGGTAQRVARPTETAEFQKRVGQVSQEPKENWVRLSKLNRELHQAEDAGDLSHIPAITQERTALLYELEDELRAQELKRLIKVKPEATLEDADKLIGRSIRGRMRQAIRQEVMGEGEFLGRMERGLKKQLDVGFARDTIAQIDRLIKAAPGSPEILDLADTLLKNLSTVSGQADQISRQYRETRTRRMAMKAISSKDVTDEMVRELAAIDYRNVRETTKTLLKFRAQEIEEPSFWERYHWLRVGSLLSSVGTQVTNTLGTGLMTAVGLPDRAAAATLEAMLRPNQPRYAYFGQVLDELAGAQAGFSLAAKEALLTYRTGIPVNPVRDLRIMTATPIDTPGFRWLNQIFRFMTMSDDFYSHLNFNMALQAEAGVVAQHDGVHISRILTNLEQYPEVVERAKGIARERVLISEPEGFARHLAGLRRASIPLPGTMGGSLPVGNFVVPFYTTLSNIARLGLVDYQPWGFLVANLEQDPYIRAQLRGKAAVGSMLMAAGYMGVANGSLTGVGTSEEDVRRAERETGWKPMSLHVGDQYIPVVSQLGPLGFPLFAGAALRELHEDLARTGRAPDVLSAGKALPMYRDDERVIGKILSYFTRSVGEVVWSQAGLQTLEGLMDLTSRGGRYGPGEAESLLESLAVSFIPATGLLGMVTRVTGTTVRSPDDVFEAIKARIPLVERTVPAQIDVYGEEQQRAFGGVGAILPIAGARKEQFDSVRQEALRLEHAGYNASPRFMRREFQRSETRIPLKADEWRRMQAQAGQMAHAALKEQIDSPMWQSMTDEHKASIYQGIWAMSRRVARAQLWMEPEIQDRLLRQRSRAFEQRVGESPG